MENSEWATNKIKRYLQIVDKALGEHICDRFVESRIDAIGDLIDYLTPDYNEVSKVLLVNGLLQKMRHNVER